ncbi:MAG: nucleotidyltransferase domain-containing protein [Clostridium celatum]|nr:nucleotidyltransferase domain-containing protein [Clostridium celatum]
MFLDRSIEDAKSKDEILDIINSFDFKNIFFMRDIKNIIIFGSLYNGNFTVESDVDIAIIRKNKLSFTEELEIITELEDILGRNVDIIDINDDNINNVIKFDALNSKLIINNDELLEESRIYYDRLYKENEEFWCFLDKAVLGDE